MLLTSDADEAVHGAVLALVVGALDEDLIALAAHGDLAGHVEAQRALGALDRRCAGPAMVTSTPAGIGIGERPMRDMAGAPYQT